MDCGPLKISYPLLPKPFFCRFCCVCNARLYKKRNSLLPIPILYIWNQEMIEDILEADLFKKPIFLMTGITFQTNLRFGGNSTLFILLPAFDITSFIWLFLSRCCGHNHLKKYRILICYWIQLYFHWSADKFWWQIKKLLFLLKC